jgi:DNA-binding transcriptional ArsR family regulator
LLEILLCRDRAVFTSEIAEELPLSTTRVGQILSELEEGGLVTRKQVSGRNLYRLSDDGFDQLADELRAHFD